MPVMSNDKTITKVRETSQERFDEAGYPARKAEDFTYVDTADLHDLAPVENFGKKAELPDIEYENIKLVIVDGAYDKKLSNLESLPEGVQVLSFGQADENDLASVLKNADTESDPFAMINGAVFDNGVAVSVGADSRPEAPLQIVSHTTKGANGLMTSPRISITIGSSADVDIIYTETGEEGDWFADSVLHINIGESANVRFYTERGLSGYGKSFSRFHITQSAKSRLEIIEVLTGTANLRGSFDWHLAGENATAKYESIAGIGENNQSHIHMRLYHDAKNCESRIRVKNGLTGNATVSTDGTVLVGRGASGTDSNQLVTNLLLSDKASANTKPNLIIENDDVDCSHGATVGGLDDESIFYLKSRGFSADQARSILLTGFIKESLRLISVESVAKRANKNILTNLAV